MHRIALLSFVVACASSSSSSVGPAAPQPPEAPPAQGNAVTVSGYWSGQWGKLVLRENADGTVVGAYGHDQGTLVGTRTGDTLVAWWCETPSRRPPQDAGDVEMTFVTGADGTRRIDGRWRYGAEGRMREDWDLALDASAPPAELVQRLDDAAAFCTKP